MNNIDVFCQLSIFFSLFLKTPIDLSQTPAFHLVQNVHIEENYNFLGEIYFTIALIIL